MAEPFSILIADPNPHVRSFLVRELTAAGYRAAEAGTAKEILKGVLSDPPPDLLVMEIDMPVRIGVGVVERLQNLAPPVPLIIYSHLTEYENHPAVSGAADFIEKNENVMDLLQSIAAIARISRDPLRYRAH